MCDEKNYESLSVVRPHRSPRKCVTKIKTQPFQFQPNARDGRESPTPRPRVRVAPKRFQICRFTTVTATHHTTLYGYTAIQRFIASTSEHPNLSIAT